MIACVAVVYCAVVSCASLLARNRYSLRESIQLRDSQQVFQQKPMASRAWLCTDVSLVEVLGWQMMEMLLRAFLAFAAR